MSVVQVVAIVLASAGVLIAIWRIYWRLLAMWRISRPGRSGDIVATFPGDQPPVTEHAAAAARRGEPAPEQRRQDGEEAIRVLVPGKTFAEVGGLWGTVNEKATTALLAGAREATMIDIQPAGNRLWQAFNERCRERGVSGCHRVVGDLGSDRFTADVGRFDITHCAGVIYHMPNPINAIHNMIRITRERILLWSQVVPERITNKRGSLRLRSGECLLVPALEPEALAVLQEHYLAAGREKVATEGLSPQEFVRAGEQLLTGPWWWLYTAETFIRMCGLFDQVEIERTWKTGMQAGVQARILDGRVTASHSRQEGMRHEAAFWRSVVAGTHPNKTYIDLFQQRAADRARPFQPHLANLVGHLAPGSVVRVLDVGSGPLSQVGTVSEQWRIDLVAVDPLADEYRALFEEFGLAWERECPRPGGAETLADAFPEDSFDLVYCRNALDHARDPLLGIRQMVRVCKAGGAVFLAHSTNEGRKNRYRGLHQWDMCPGDDGDLAICAPGGRQPASLRVVLRGVATVQAAPAGKEWHTAVIRPTHTAPDVPSSSGS